MSVNLHLLNAQGKLSKLEDRIVSEFTASLTKITHLMPVEGVDVIVSAGSAVLPETGLGGFCPQDDLVYLQIDPNNSRLLNNFSEEFVATLGHELHHCIRRRKVGYGITLSEALVTEGLACHFETELRTTRVPFYAIALSQNEIRELWGKATLELSNQSYDHAAWFFGSKSKAIPRHAGYSLGFQAVNEYVNKIEVPASRLCGALADDVLHKG